MACLLQSELEREFSLFGIDITGNIAIAEKFQVISTNYGLDSDSIIAKWFTYNNKTGKTITPDAIDDFERKLSCSSKGAKKVTPLLANSYNLSTINQIVADVNAGSEQDKVIGSYTPTTVTPNVQHDSVKRAHNTPEETVFNKRAASSTPCHPTYHTSISPKIITPSLKYESRTGKGEVNFSYYGVSCDLEKATLNWKGCAKHVSVIPYPDCNVTTHYKYMFEKLHSKAYVLNEVINVLANQMKENLMLDEYEDVITQTQDDITICGRICCDAAGRLNSKSIVLEGSIEISNGERIPLELGSVSNYSLFPGQVVAFQGKNSSGTSVSPISIYCGSKLPSYTDKDEGVLTDDGQFTLYTACGPYATHDSDSLSYTPLESFMEVILNDEPDVVIMLGPFVDIKHPMIQTGKIEYTFDELFHFICNRVTSTIKDLKTIVIFVPSQRDVCHDFVYPQPPFMNEPGERIKMVSDPCTIMINGVSIGMTSTDVLFHLSAEEVSSFSGKTDRLGRLAEHLLKQQCYYPLYPTSEEVNLEYGQFENYCFMPFTPDILLIPSDLRYFIKDLDGSLCINPGRLVKGQTGGTFLKLLLRSKKYKSSVADRSVAEIIRI